MDSGSTQYKRELYTYDAPWPIYAMNWSQRVDKPFRLAIGSFVEDVTNKIRIVQLNKHRDMFEPVAEVDHTYPATKILWMPQKANQPDLFGVFYFIFTFATSYIHFFFPIKPATSGDYLRIWEMGHLTAPKAHLNNAKQSEFCAPLTSFDWNETNPDILGTSSIDTTCTIWSLETMKVSFYIPT